MSMFKCVGTACEETCCSSFHVDVDRTTFKAYMAVKEPGLRQDLQRYVKKLREPRSPGAYDIVMMSTDFFQTATGETVRLYAMQTCIGQMKGAEIEISCEVRQATEADYPANNFRLKYIPDSIGLWRGTTPMDADTAVEFIAFGE